jgi:V8-like Glu-specific endopeptidase
MNLYLALGGTALSLSLGLTGQSSEPIQAVNSLIAADVTPESTPDGVPTVVTNLAELGLDLENATPLIPEGLTASNNPAEGSRAVLGVDERVLITSRSYPWSAVGQISGVTPDGGYICTGSLVAEDIVLTNAHCVVDPKTGQVARNIRFRPNLINGQVANANDIANVTTLLVGTDFADGRIVNPDDWALIAIDKPLGQKYGTLTMTPVSTTALANFPFLERLVMVGYSGDIPANNPGQTASAHVGCSIVEEQEEILLHLCDTFGGSSGGPILSLGAGGVSIVGLNSAEARDPNTEEGVINFAVKIPRILSQLRAMGN